MRKQAVNYVFVEYAKHKKNRGGERVEYGIRKKLVKQAIEKFGIEGNFDVRKQTIFNRISLNRLQVWHPGTESPLLEVEVVLTSFIYTAHRHNKLPIPLRALTFLGIRQAGLCC